MHDLPRDAGVFRREALPADIGQKNRDDVENGSDFPESGADHEAFERRQGGMLQKKKRNADGDALFPEFAEHGHNGVPPCEKAAFEAGAAGDERQAERENAQRLCRERAADKAVRNKIGTEKQRGKCRRR